MQSDSVFEILVVDDEPPICELLATLAQKEFSEARFVNTRSVQETYDYLDQNPHYVPQLILLDIDLRQSKNGLDMLPKLRTHFKGQVPIIILSGVNDDRTVQQSYAQGAVAFTQKPDDMPAWRHYVRMLKTYWQQVSRLPTTDPQD